MTDAGELLVGRARRILAEVDAANAEMQRLAGVQTGHVSVGTMHTMGPIDVSIALAIFHQRHPGVELTVREQSSEELAEMLRVDEIDLAFLSVTERIESHGLGPAPARLRGAGRGRCRPTTAWPARRRVRMDELSEEHFISYREGARLRELLVAAGHQAGFEPQVKLESNESQRIRRLVARGLGVAILPRSDGREPRRRGRGRPAGRTGAATRHHARLARRPTPATGRGRVRRVVAGDLRPRDTGGR